MGTPGYYLAVFCQTLYENENNLAQGGRFLPPLTKAPIQKSTNVNILAFYIEEKIQTILNPNNYEFGLYKTLIYFRKY